MKTNNIKPMTEKPKLWERSDAAFLDDEHISQNMLKAHLDPNSDGASRKHDFIDKSLKWLYQVIPNGSKILDLGCGPGLYTKVLSEHGYDVIGVDLSRRSISYAKEQDNKTTYICSNYLDLKYENEFDFITLIYCDYGALTKPERIQLLKIIYKALKPNGKLIFDVFSLKYLEKIDTEAVMKEYSNGGFWAKEPYSIIEQDYLYPSENAVVRRSQIITSQGVKEFLLWDTTYSIESITDELGQVDFSVESYYGDVTCVEYTDDSETICIIAVK